MKPTKKKRNREPKYTVDNFIEHNYDDLMVEYEEQYPEHCDNSWDYTHTSRYQEWEYERARELCEEHYEKYLDNNAERENPTEQAKYEAKQAKYEEYAID